MTPLVDKLCEFMAMPSIDDLSPLEESVISKSDSISAKWKAGNGYNPSQNKGSIVDSQEISGKWASGSGYITPNNEERRKKIASAITEKFKKPE